MKSPCVAYAHVPDELRKKLDDKGHKCIFVGYFEDTKSYKLYDLVARKVIIGRYVQFFENESWDGIVNINVKIVSNVDHDDMKEEVVQTPHVSQKFYSHDTMTLFNIRTINTSCNSSYADKHTKRTTDSNNHLVKFDIDRSSEAKNNA